MDQVDTRIAFVAATDPDRPALADESGDSCTYGTLQSRIRTGAAALNALGVGPGIPVMLVAGNRIAQVAAYLAVLHSDGVAVPFGSGGAPARLTGVCAAGDFPVAITDATSRETVRDLFPDAQERDRLPDGMTVFVRSGGGVTLPEGTAHVLHTSGTTGTAKGVMISHRALAAWVETVADAVGYDDSRREAAVLPLAHSYPLGQLLCVLTRGGFVWVQDGVSPPQTLFDAMEIHHLTGLAATPSLLRVLVDRFGAEFAKVADRLRVVTTNSEALPRPLAERLFVLAPEARLVMYYGLSEASRHTAAVVDRTLSGWDGDVGRPFRGASVSIRDAQGRAVAPGETGEVCLDGPNLFVGYWQRPDLTEAAMRDGSLRTGDLGRIDDAGRLFLNGRLDDMVNVGGVKVAPQEVERLLATDPDIRDVAAAGIPDPLGLTGERIGVVAVTRPGVGAAEVRRLCARVLDAAMRPARVVVVDAVPRAPGGKVRRTAVRDLLLTPASADGDR